jgi:hypothetical protein
MTRDKTARWLDLLAYRLQHRFPVTREDIFGHVAAYQGDEGESLRRKFERDKDDLRGLGIDIETVELPERAGDEPTTGYRLRAATSWPGAGGPATGGISGPIGCSTRRWRRRPSRREPTSNRCVRRLTCFVPRKAGTRW